MEWLFSINAAATLQLMVVHNGALQQVGNKSCHMGLSVLSCFSTELVSFHRGCVCVRAAGGCTRRAEREALRDSAADGRGHDTGGASEEMGVEQTHHQRPAGKPVLSSDRPRINGHSIRPAPGTTKTQ